MEFQKAMTELRKGGTSANYLLFGSEIHLQNEFLHTLRKEMSKQGELDCTSFDMQENDLESILESAEMYSFFSEYRVMIVNNVTWLSSKSSLDKPQVTLLENYLSNPNPQTIIVWRVLDNKLDNRKKITQHFLKHATVVETSQLSEEATERYIQQVLQQVSFKMTPAAQKEMMRRVQGQLSQWMNEFEKIKTYAQEEQIIDVEVIRQLVPRNFETDVFELTNTVLNGNGKMAVQQYQDLLVMKHEPIAIQALFISQIRLMIHVQQLGNAGYLQQDMASQLGVHPYRIKLAIQSSRKFPLPQLFALYELLIDTDFKMKQGIGAKDTHFYTFLANFLKMQ